MLPCMEMHHQHYYHTITSKGKMKTFRKINKKWLVESGACSLLEAVCNVFIPAKEEKEEERETTE